MNKRLAALSGQKLSPPVTLPLHNAGDGLLQKMRIPGSPQKRIEPHGLGGFLQVDGLDVKAPVREVRARGFVDFGAQVRDDHALKGFQDRRDHEAAGFAGSGPGAEQDMPKGGVFREMPAIANADPAMLFQGPQDLVAFGSRGEACAGSAGIKTADGRKK